MKYLGFLLALAIPACVPSHPPHVPHTGVVHDLEAKTVALVDSDGGQIRATCSGVWVRENDFVTADHCLAKSPIGAVVPYVVREDVLVGNADSVERVRFGVLVARAGDRDLALVRVKAPPSHLVASVRAPTVGQGVHTMGHPKGLWWSFSAGHVASIRQLEDLAYPGTWWVQSTAPISPGNSGGGLFDDHGDLLGICHAYIPMYAENVNFYVDSRYVSELLEGAK